MATLRRNKYGKIHYAKLITGTAIAVLTDDPAAAAEIDETTARAIVDAHKSSGSRGQLQVLDAKGKVLASAGDPGEPPPPPKPVASLPGLAERVEKLEERVEMIEASDAGGTGGGIVTKQLTESQIKEIEAALAKSKGANWIALPAGVDPKNLVLFTPEEAASLKGMLGEWASHKSREAAKETSDPKTSKATAGTGGGQKAPTAPVVPAG